MEERIKEYLVYFLAKQKRLIRLLQLTKDNKNEIVQELRKEVREYVNETEKYIAEIEMENLNLSLTVAKFDDYVKQCVDAKAKLIRHRLRMKSLNQRN